MKVNSFLPFGFFSKEAGLISLISNYVRTYGLSVTPILCNGVISACQRDSESGWQRDFNSCLQCISEQNRLAAWSQDTGAVNSAASAISTISLSKFLHPQDIDQTKRWILGLSREELLEANFEGLPLGSLCQHSLIKQFQEIDLQNRSVEMAVRRVLLSAARISRAFKTYSVAEKPDYLLMAGGQDFLSSVARVCLKQKKIAVSLFCYNEACNEIVVENPRNGKVSSYPLVFDNVTNFRTDPRSWPPELLKVLEELIAFIDLTPSQISLPISAVG